MSTQLFDKVLCFMIKDEDQFTHLPQFISIASNISISTPQDQNELSSDRERVRYNWTDDSMERLLGSDLIPTFYKNIEIGDTEKAANTVSTLLQEIAQGNNYKVQNRNHEATAMMGQ